MREYNEGSLTIWPGFKMYNLVLIGVLFYIFYSFSLCPVSSGNLLSQCRPKAININDEPGEKVR